jgi:hypothetical protein
MDEILWFYTKETKMRIQLFTLCVISFLTAGCSVHHKHPNVKNPYGDCAVIAQRLNRGPAQNANPNNNPVIPTDRTQLLKLYNMHGCNIDSDNRYALPNQSLQINEKLNTMPVKPPAKYKRKKPKTHPLFR